MTAVLMVTLLRAVSTFLDLNATATYDGVSAFVYHKENISIHKKSAVPLKLRSLMPTEAVSSLVHMKNSLYRARASKQARSAVANIHGSIGVLVLFSAAPLLAISFDVAAEVGNLEPISPVPMSLPLNDLKVQLGRTLFTDSRLSSGNGVSCASCHLLDKAFTDGVSISRGLPDNPGILNTPTLYNVALNAKLNWSGKSFTLEEQADQVVENPRIMGGRWEEIILTLRSDSRLSASFNEIYAEGITRENVTDAIVEFEKSLLTPDAPFDRYLKGDRGAISPQAVAGYNLFKDYGCASCHQGVNVGGNMLQVFGIFGTPDSAASGEETPGSAEGSGIALDNPVFRVPPLRNVQKTAPYFHDGSAISLKDAIDVMATYQLGRQISQDDTAKIEAFLNSLTGEGLATSQANP